MTVPVVASSSGLASASTASIIGNRPAGTADGDLLVAFVLWGSGLTFSGAPSGWTQAGSEVVNGGTGVRLRAYWKIAASEPVSWTWTLSGVSNGVVMVARVTGHDAASPIDTQAGTVDDTSNTTSSCSGVTTGVSDCLVLTGHAANANVTFTAHASTTESQDLTVAAARAGMMCWEARPSAGATGGRNATMSGSEVSVALCVSVRPAASAGREPSLLIAA